MNGYMTVRETGKMVVRKELSARQQASGMGTYRHASLPDIAGKHPLHIYRYPAETVTLSEKLSDC